MESSVLAKNWLQYKCLNVAMSEWIKFDDQNATHTQQSCIKCIDKIQNSILTDNAKRAIQGNVAMHVTLPGGQLWNQCKWCHLVAKFATNASGAIWWLNLQLK